MLSPCQIVQKKLWSFTWKIRAHFGHTSHKPTECHRDLPPRPAAGQYCGGGLGATRGPMDTCASWKTSGSISPRTHAGLLRAATAHGYLKSQHILGLKKKILHGPWSVTYLRGNWETMAKKSTVAGSPETTTDPAFWEEPRVSGVSISGSLSGILACAAANKGQKHSKYFLEIAWWHY